jgi:hypothetical protein
MADVMKVWNAPANWRRRELKHRAFLKRLRGYWDRYDELQKLDKAKADAQDGPVS